MGQCLFVIGSGEVGVLEKRYGPQLQHGFIAMNNEAGFQPQIHRSGVWVFNPIKYSLHIAPMITIGVNKIGYVFARDGLPLTSQEALGRDVTSRDFSSAAEFLRKGGKRGPQRAVLRSGTYAINLALFAVITEDGVYAVGVNEIDRQEIDGMCGTIKARKGFSPVVIGNLSDCIGIVTVQDGPSLQQGTIIAPVVGDDPNVQETYHHSFEDADRFIAAGGQRGRQQQVLTDGSYFINRLFATVEIVPKTVIEAGMVGVVVSNVGEEGADTSGADFKHGTLVRRGQRGVWEEVLMPGKYAFNTFSGSIITVPTTNFILKWTSAESGAHRLDENLTEITLITKDAFEPTLPLSVVVHICFQKAPYIVQRFGNVKQLVEQTLDPMVAAYFKNIGQTKTLIELVQNRSEIQQLAAEEMREKFVRYNLELEEVLIGTPASKSGSDIEDILKQLRDRQVAEEQVITYHEQQLASAQERKLNEAKAKARQQAGITKSEIQVKVLQFEGRASYVQSVHDANRIRETASAEAEQAARMGLAEAMCVQEKVRAYGGPQFQLTQQVMEQFANAIASSGTNLVPQVVVGSSAGVENAFQGLMNMVESRLSVQASRIVEEEEIEHEEGDEEIANELKRQMRTIKMEIRKSLSKPQTLPQSRIVDEDNSNETANVSSGAAAVAASYLPAATSSRRSKKSEDRS